MAHKTFWKTDTPIDVAKRVKRETFESDLRWAYGVVEKADKLRCHLTGQKLERSTADPWRCLTHHHLRERSLAKSRRTEPANIICISLALHRLVTGGALHILDSKGEPAYYRTDIDKVQWNRTRITKGKEPVRIKRELLWEPKEPTTTRRGLTKVRRVELDSGR
jgi:hypothetical protein